MLENIHTLEELQTRVPSPIDWNGASWTSISRSAPLLHLGSLNTDDYSKDSEAFKNLDYLIKNILPPLKIFKWGDIEDERKSQKFTRFNGVRHGTNAYHKFLPMGSTVLDLQGNHAGFSFRTENSEKDNIMSYVDGANPVDVINEFCQECTGSTYYHSAKAHWLTQSIIKEGLWAPIQGFTLTNGNKTSLNIHPGSVRSGIFEEMENPDMELLIWDTNNSLERLPSATTEEVLAYWDDKLSQRDGRHKNISFLYTNGVIEWQTDFAQLGFREDVFEFNKKVHQLSKGKPLTIYIGFDSNMNDLEDICKFSILKSIKESLGRGKWNNYLEFTPEIKFLDIAKLSEYNREYANQSTEFTYSRFLIPYLENYEGFSLFVDNDFIFTKTPLSMFNYLNPDDAVACIKYPHYEHDATKFDGEVNIDYPCKLWSSMMFFNNGQEDCKKLTPEVVNTWTGKQLHQFEWTDKISEIPQKYIFVEGYDNPEEKWDYTGIHYTRGGPWIKDMDSTTINNLEVYNKYKNLYTKE